MTTSPFLRAALALSLTGLAACWTHDQRTDLVLTKVVQPTAATGGCNLDATAKETTHLVVDLDNAPEFAVGAVLANRLLDNSNQNQGRLNSHDFQASSVRVRYEFPDPAYAGSLGEIIAPASGMVPALGVGAIDVPLLTFSGITQLRALALPASGLGTMRAKVRLEGELLDGVTVNTSEYSYVFNVCRGCVLPPPSCPVGQVVVPGCTPGVNADPDHCGTP